MKLQLSEKVLIGLDAGVIIAGDLDTANGRLLQGTWLPNDGGLVR